MMFALDFVLGLILGAAAGYFGGKTDMIIMRIMDIFLAIPGTLLAICIVASLGNSIPNLVIAQAVSSIPTFSRVVRGAVITARDADYVEAARAIGAKDATIIFHEVLPNSLAPIIVQTTFPSSDWESRRRDRSGAQCSPEPVPTSVTTATCACSRALQS